MFTNILAFSLLLAQLQVLNGFYLPGVAPHSYVDGEEVDLKVNKLRYALYRSQLRYRSQLNILDCFVSYS